MVGRRSELAEIHRLRIRIRGEQRVAASHALLRAHLERIVVAAGAVALVENSLGDTKRGEKRPPRVEIARSGHRRIQIESAVQMAADVADIPDREIEIGSHLPLHCEVPLIDVRNFLVRRNVGGADAVRQWQQSIRWNSREHYRRRSRGQPEHRHERGRAPQVLRHDRRINVRRQVVERPAKRALKVAAAETCAHHCLRINRVCGAHARRKIVPLNL